MRNEYVLRPGEYLVRRESEGPRDWRWHEVKKVTYFTPDDVVDAPGGSSFLARNFVFRRGGWLIAARPEQLLTKPTYESLRECILLLTKEC